MMSVNIMPNQHESCTRTYISKIIKFFENDYYRYLIQASIYDLEHLSYLTRSFTKRVHYPNMEVQNLVLCYLSIMTYYNDKYNVKITDKYLSCLWARTYHQGKLVNIQLDMCFSKHKMKSWLGDGRFIFKLTNGILIKIDANSQSYINDLPKMVHKAINNV